MPSSTLHVGGCKLLVVGLMASIGANKGRKRKLTAAEIAALLEVSSDSDSDNTEFDDSDNKRHFKCI